MSVRHLAVVSVAAIALLSTVAAAQPDGERGDRRQRRAPMSPESLMEHDANGDGMLSRDELPERMANRLFDRADADGDGFIDKAELETLFANRRGGQRGAGDRPDRPDRPARGARGGTFESRMSAAGRAMGALRESALDASSLDGDLQQVNAVQAALIGAKSRIDSVELSDHARERFGDNRKAYRMAFRLELLNALGESMTLERALLDGNTVGAKASVRALLAIRNRGHDAFQHGDEDEHAEDGDEAKDDRPERRRGERGQRGNRAPGRPDGNRPGA